jgi:hypothetical protein
MDTASTHLSRVVNGVVVRKGRKSGAGNDCAFATSPDSGAPFVWDSKGEKTLHCPTGGLVAWLKNR